MTWWITDTSIGQRLKFVRRFRRLTQKELGLLMGIPRKQRMSVLLSMRKMLEPLMQKPQRNLQRF